MSFELTREKIVEVLGANKPKSLTEVFRLMGAQGGKLSGATANRMRELVEGIDNLVANNKASAGTAKTEVPEIPLKTKPSKKADKKPAKAPAKTAIPRHPKNPFREGSGYGLMVDIIADAGADGIGKEDILKKYCRLKNKSEKLACYDLAVINSASETSEKRHRSCADSFTILKDGDNFRIRFG